MLVEDGPVMLHLPVPPGERVDVDSVRFDGKKVPVYASSADDPALVLRKPVRALLSYRTGPGPSHFLPPAQGRPIPEAMAPKLRAWRSRPREEQVRRATAYVRKVLRYSQNPEESYASPWIPEEGFISRTMRAGVGDCDVQNAVLMLTLQELGIPARLAVGFVGDAGRTHWAGHGWVEYQREDGTLGVADATLKPKPNEALPELPDEEDPRPLAAGGSSPAR
jgi:transglutaminase-like putative cysteine protease